MNTMTARDLPPPKFLLGALYFTRPALFQLNSEDSRQALKRHSAGDWGDVCEDDRLANETALLYGGRLFSVYHDRAKRKFWIITEADRNATNVELHISGVMLSLQKC